MNSIEINHISKSFGEKIVLKDISLVIEEGEIFGLLGPSGAGKTTLIKILTGQIKPVNGTAKLFECETNSLERNVYKQIGMVLDNSGLYERLSCYDNLILYAKIHHVKKSRIDEVLSRVGLLEDKKKAANKLSKGMRQRLILARSILHNPKILFLDEPTSGLDPATTKNIHELLFELQSNGTTIFLTTHNMEEATKLCKNIALLNDGEIVEYGAPDDICRKYNTLNTVSILCKDGNLVTLPNSKESALAITKYFEYDIVEAIHSSEPNLETVFIELTGRGLS